MRSLAASIFLMVWGLVLGIVFCWLYHLRQEPREIVRTDTVHVDRPILKRDTVTVTKPVERRIYQTVTDTVREYVTLPVGFRPGGIIGQQPLRVTPQTITLTYWQPDASRFEQSVYEVPQPKVHLWADTGLALTPVGTALTAAPGFTWRDKISAWGGIMAVQDEHLTLGWTAGVRYRFTIFER